MENRGPDGIISCAAPRPDGYREILEPLRQYADQAPGILLEDKGYSIAVHYRKAAHQVEPARAVVETALAEAGEGYQILRGNMVLEIKPKGVDKGTAVHAPMSRAPFAGKQPVFIGEDPTDEDGFAAVNKMHGLSIRVGINGSSCAQYQMKNVDALFQWLSRINNLGDSVLSCD